MAADLTEGFLEYYARELAYLRERGADFASAYPKIAAVDAACKTATAIGTRLGLLGVTLIYAWAGLHYLLAAITLPRDIARARAAQAA